MNKFWSKTIDLFDDVLAYILTIAGIMISNYLPMLKTNSVIHVELDIWRLVISAIVAIMIIGKQEVLTKDELGTTEKARAGRRKKFGSRMFNAVGQGMMWSQIVGMAK